MSDYWGEFRTEWRALASVTLGLSFGLIMMSYAIGIMGPHLIRQFGWSQATFVAIQTLSLLAVVVYPFVGRLADRITARKTALIGVAASPVLFLGLSVMGDLTSYAVLFTLQSVILSTTTPPVLCRVIVQRFKQAKGLALATAVAGPSLLAAVGGPLLNNFVVDHGWRAGYVALAVASLIGGGLAIALMPSDLSEAPQPPKKKAARGDYALIFRTPAFWLLNASVLLCTLPMSVMVTQLGLVVGEHGVIDKTVSIIVSSYAIGMLVGRLISGFALDRLPGPLVASGSLAMSAAGLFVMSQQGGSVAVLAVAVLAVGLSFGAESDIVGYLISRYFPVRVYGSVFGIISSTITVSTTAGAALMSVMLSRTGSYSPFLLIASISVFLGSMMFLLLPRRHGEPEHEPALAREAAVPGG